MPITIRKATRQDAVHLATLLDIASRGLVVWLWQTMSAPGQSAMEIGRERILDVKDSPSHFSNWMVVTLEGDIAGAFAAYPLSNPSQASDVEELPQVYRPMLELESHATGSWYIMTLSVYPEFRNKGLGTVMLKKVEDIARSSDYRQLSIMLVSDNTAALRLYDRFGFKETHRRRYMPFPGSRDTGDWLLLKKDI